MRRGAIFLLCMCVLFISACDKEAVECGLENCHGIDFSCGFRAPQACTLEFAPGDECREFVECKVIDGECELVEKPGFDMCIISVGLPHRADERTDAEGDNASEEQGTENETGDEHPPTANTIVVTIPSPGEEEVAYVDEGGSTEDPDDNSSEGESAEENGTIEGSTGPCAGEGEDSEQGCCAGLTEWLFGTDTRISVDGECYETTLEPEDPVGICLNCGDGDCKGYEDVCNCPEDCDEESVYTLEEFCMNPDWQNNCAGSMSGELPCTLC